MKEPLRAKKVAKRSDSEAIKIKILGKKESENKNR